MSNTSVGTSEIPRNYTWRVTPLRCGSFGKIYVVNHPNPKEAALVMKVVKLPSGKSSMWMPRMEFEALKRIEECPNSNTYVVEQPRLGSGVDNIWWSKRDATLTMLFKYYPTTLSEIHREYTLIRHPDYLKNIIYDLVHGLDYLHGLGIIHKDIKPDNIFIDAHGICKIGDLGGAFVLSRIHSLDHGAIKTNDRGIRTYNYSAPEIIIPIDERDRYNLPLWCYDATVDFWSLGMTIYELVVGEALKWCEYYGSGVADKIIIDPSHVPPLMHQILTSNACDPAIFDFIEKSCRVNPAERLCRQTAVVIVSEWESYEEPFKNRFVTPTNETMSRRRFMASDALPSHLPGKAHPAEAKKIAKISSTFAAMLNKSGVIIPEHSKYHYLEMEAEPNILLSGITVYPSTPSKHPYI